MNAVVDSPSALASRAYELIGKGELSLAQRLLQSADLHESPTVRRCDADLAEALTVVCALRGFSEECHDALACVRRARGAESQKHRTDLLKAFVALIEGDIVLALETAAPVLAGVGVQPRTRNAALALLAGAYLSIGDSPRGLECTAAMTAPTGERLDLGWHLGRLFEGEIHLRDALRGATGLPPREGRVTRTVSRAGTVEMLAHRALHCFHQVRWQRRSIELLDRLAEAGESIANALTLPRESGKRVIAYDLGWLDKSGLRTLHRSWRWTLGLFALSRGELSLGHAWLIPLASTSIRQGLPIHEFEWVRTTAQLLSVETQGVGPTLSRALAGQQGRWQATLRAAEGIDLPALLSGRSARRRLSGRDLVERVERTVRDSISKPQNVGSLARIAGVSRRKLEISFRATTGQSPKEFITALRLDEAHRKMREGQDRSREALRRIANETGFASYRRFAQSYTATFGVPPTDAMVRLAHPSDRGPVGSGRSDPEPLTSEGCSIERGLLGPDPEALERVRAKA